MSYIEHLLKNERKELPFLSCDTPDLVTFMDMVHETDDGSVIHAPIGKGVDERLREYACIMLDIALMQSPYGNNPIQTCIVVISQHCSGSLGHTMTVAPYASCDYNDIILQFLAGEGHFTCTERLCELFDLYEEGTNDYVRFDVDLSKRNPLLASLNDFNTKTAACQLRISPRPPTRIKAHEQEEKVVNPYTCIIS